jgi:AraC family transcriptional activator of tynA and feaB
MVARMLDENPHRGEASSSLNRADYASADHDHASVNEYLTNGTEPLAVWRTHMEKVYYSLEVIPRRGDRVIGRLAERKLKSFVVSRFWADAHKVVRRSEAAEVDGVRDLLFCFPKSGSINYLQRGCQNTIKPGGMGIVNTAEYYESEVIDGSEYVGLQIPYDLLKMRLGHITEFFAHPELAEPELVPIIRRFASQLLLMKNSATSFHVQDMCLDLIIVMAEAGYKSVKGSRQSATLSEIIYADLQNLISANFSNSNLSVEDAADSCRISVRYVHKIFHARNSTFGNRLMEKRLKEAHRILSSGTRSHLQIGQIAYQCGFLDQAHFATRYRQRYGTTPSETRRTALAG